MGEGGGEDARESLAVMRRINSDYCSKINGNSRAGEARALKQYSNPTKRRMKSGWQPLRTATSVIRVQKSLARSASGAIEIHPRIVECATAAGGTEGMMHTNHLGLDSKPFNLKDPRGFYRNADLDAACAALLQGIRTQQGLLLLTGEAGLGKSLILRRCMAEASDIRFILLGNPPPDFSDLLDQLGADLELPGNEPDTERRSQQLRDALAVYASQGQVVALLVDDAHRLRIDTLRQLWEFVVGAVVAGDQRLRVVLAGLPEIEGKLRQPELRPLQESLRVECRLGRLSAVETSQFLTHQFSVAGHADDWLSPAVVERVVHYSQGVPRAIALLCDTILLLTSLQTEHVITPALVDEAARSCFLNDPTDAPPAPLTAPSPSVGDEFDFTGTDLDFSFDFALDETPVAEQTVTVAAATPAETTPVAASAPQPVDADANAGPVPAAASPQAVVGSAPTLLPPRVHFCNYSTKSPPNRIARTRRTGRSFVSFAIAISGWRAALLPRG